MVKTADGTVRTDGSVHSWGEDTRYLLNNDGNRRNKPPLRSGMIFYLNLLAIACLLHSCRVAGFASCRRPPSPSWTACPTHHCGREYRYKFARAASGAISTSPLAATSPGEGDGASGNASAAAAIASSTTTLLADAAAADGDEARSRESACGILLRDGLRRASVAVDASTSDAIFRSSPVLKRMRDSIVRGAAVGPSSLDDPRAGLGLFASRNLKAGTVVGLYPTHALGCEFECGASVFVTSDGDGRDDAHFRKIPHATSPYLHATDQPLFRRPSLISSMFDNVGETSPPLYLDVNPDRNDEMDGAWTSHYINDGASLLGAAEREAMVTDADVERYYAESTRAKNCIHVPFGPSPVLATVTTKKVKKGEELFTSYGVVYWLGAVAELSSAAAPVMNERIQSQIMESARDLSKAMEGARLTYATEMQDLENAFRDV